MSVCVCVCQMNSSGVLDYEAGFWFMEDKDEGSLHPVDHQGRWC